MLSEMGNDLGGAKLAHYTEIPAEPFGEEAPGVSIRVLIDGERDGAPVYVLRMIEIAAGGNTPDHSHPFEHENYVLSGRGSLMIEGEWHPLSEGHVAFVPAGVRHQYRNDGPVPFTFLCGVPASRGQA